MKNSKRILCVFSILFVIVCLSNNYSKDIKSIKYWAYLIQEQHSSKNLDDLINSKYELLVVDNTRSLGEMTDYDNKKDIDKLKQSRSFDGTNKIVVCYIDIGQAEEHRYYWEDNWKIGNPEWILALDPDGWEGNYPVKFWKKEWKDIVFNMIDRIIEDGYQGIYLDWVEDFEFQPVIDTANKEGKNSREEMIKFIEEMSIYCKAKIQDFYIIPQNGTNIIYNDNGELDSFTDKYFSAIDAVAQEDIWFDGDADPDGIPGDIPVDTLLTQEYIDNLSFYTSEGIKVFSVDYAVKKENADSCYRLAKKFGYIEYVSMRQLNKLSNTAPPDLISGLEDSYRNGFNLDIVPNPFSESTSINYELQTVGRVQIDIFNSLGEKITTLVDEWQEAGRSSVVFSVGNTHACSLPSGLYYYRIQIGERIESGKLLLIK